MDVQTGRIPELWDLVDFGRLPCLQRAAAHLVLAQVVESSSPVLDRQGLYGNRAVYETALALIEMSPDI